MGNNTSGYEIRQGLLGQAQDILQNNAHMHFERTKEWVPVTTEAIIAEAEKLNGFVQRKNTRRMSGKTPIMRDGRTRPRNHYDDVGDETFLKLVARMGYENAYRHESDDSDNDFNEAANTQTD